MAGDRAEEMYFVLRGVVRLDRSAPDARNDVSKTSPASLRPRRSEMQGSEADGEREDLTAAAAAAEQTESTIAGPGDAFGEVGLFADIGGAFQGETARVDSEEADLYVLPAGRVAELEGRYPAEMRRLRELCEMRAAEALVRARAAGAAARPAEGSLAGCRCKRLVRGSLPLSPSVRPSLRPSLRPVSLTSPLLHPSSSPSSLSFVPLPPNSLSGSKPREREFNRHHNRRSPRARGLAPESEPLPLSLPTPFSLPSPLCVLSECANLSDFYV